MKTTLTVLAVLGLFALAFAACSSSQTSPEVVQDDDMTFHPPASADPTSSATAPATAPLPAPEHPQPVS